VSPERVLTLGCWAPPAAAAGTVRVEASVDRFKRVSRFSMLRVSLERAAMRVSCNDYITLCRRTIEYKRH